MNICMLIARFPPFVGGTEIQCDRLSRALAALGHRLTILTEQPPRHPAIAESPPGIEIRRFETIGRPPWSSLIYCVRALWHILRRERFDVLHAHMLASPSVLAIVAGKASGTKTVVKIACSGPYGDLATAQRTRLGRWKLKVVLGNADRLVCLTQDMERELLSAGVLPDKIARIPNGIDTDFFRPPENEAEKRQIRQSLGLALDDFYILFIGRLTPQKRPDIVLEAFRQAFGSRSNTKLVMLGDGPLRGELTTRARSEGLQSHILIAGNQPETERYCRCADLFILPSEAEGMSNSLLEAMATGLACIASRNGATEEILQDGYNGILVAPGDAGALAQAILSLANDPARASLLGQAARRTILGAYRMAIVARQYETLYAQLLHNE